MSTDREPIRIRITPEPGDEELAAITAAVAALTFRSNASDDPDQDTGGGRERWASAGRREVLRSADWPVMRESRP